VSVLLRIENHFMLKKIQAEIDSMREKKHIEKFCQTLSTTECI